VNTVAKAALLQLKDHGVQVRPGQYVQYVVRQRTAPQPHEKVCLKQVLDNDTPVDKEFYLRYLARCVESLLNPFGYTVDLVYSLLLGRNVG
jgi:DNA polymerase elongation subunit (family B)